MVTGMAIATSALANWDPINEHIFFKCSKAQRGWAATAIYYKEFPQDSALVDAISIINIIDGCLTKSPQGTAQLFIVYHTCWALWSHQNDQMYSTRRPQSLPRVIANQATEHITVAAQYCNSHKKRSWLRQAAHLI